MNCGEMLAFFNLNKMLNFCENLITNKESLVILATVLWCMLMIPTNTAIHQNKNCFVFTLNRRVACVPSPKITECPMLYCFQAK